MNKNLELLIEIEEIIESISKMKDKTLDHYYDNTVLATKLMKELSQLEIDADEMYNEFKKLI